MSAVHTAECCFCHQRDHHSVAAGSPCIPPNILQEHTWFCTHTITWFMSLWWHLTHQTCHQHCRNQTPKESPKWSPINSICDLMATENSFQKCKSESINIMQQMHSIELNWHWCTSCFSEVGNIRDIVCLSLPKVKSLIMWLSTAARVLQVSKWMSHNKTFFFFFCIASKNSNKKNLTQQRAWQFSLNFHVSGSGVKTEIVCLLHQLIVSEDDRSNGGKSNLVLNNSCMQAERSRH